MRHYDSIAGEVSKMPILPLSPDDLPDSASTDPKWLIYQKAVARLKGSFGDCQVIHDHKVKGRRSGIERQVDIWLSTTVGGKHPLTVAVECKCHETTPVSIKDVDAFYGFLEDVGAHKGVLVSNTGFTQGAERRADGATLQLETLSMEEVEDFDWAEYLEEDTCRSWNDCYGTVNWDYSDGHGSNGGHCVRCGTFHIKCRDCGTLGFYEEDTIVNCEGCENRWQLISEEEFTAGMKRLAPPPETESEELPDQKG